MTNSAFPPGVECLGEAYDRQHSKGPRSEDLVWGQREPLPPTHEPTPPLGEELLPSPFAPWIVDAARRTSVPLEFIAMPAIASASALIGRQMGIHPKCRDEWAVVPNLWGAIVGPTGVMKTHAVEEGFRHMKRLAARAQKEFEEDVEARQARQLILKLDLENAKKSAKSGRNKAGASFAGVEDEIRKLLVQIRECEEATARRYLTQDATTAMLGQLLKENPRGMMLQRDELAGWLATLDKPGNEGDREFFLEAWNGTGTHTVDRIGRGTVHVPALTLSVFGGIQPGKLQAYIDGALDHRRGDDGLLQRVQLLAWPDSIPEFTNVDQWPESEARDRAFAIFAALDDLQPEDWDAESLHERSVPALRFSGAAQELFNEWRFVLEGRLRGDEAESTPSFTGHIAKYRSLMPSLALIFHLVESLDSGYRGPVSLDAAKLACAWCDYLEIHARKLYRDEFNVGVLPAHALLKKIEQGKIRDAMPAREIYRPHWSGLTTSAAVYEGLAILEPLGHVKVLTETGVGRPSGVVYLHPELRDAG